MSASDSHTPSHLPSGHFDSQGSSSSEALILGGRPGSRAAAAADEVEAVSGAGVGGGASREGAGPPGERRARPRKDVPKAAMEWTINSEPRPCFARASSRNAACPGLLREKADAAAIAWRSRTSNAAAPARAALHARSSTTPGWRARTTRRSVSSSRCSNGPALSRKRKSSPYLADGGLRRSALGARRLETTMRFGARVAAGQPGLRWDTHVASASSSSAAPRVAR